MTKTVTREEYDRARRAGYTDTRDGVPYLLYFEEGTGTVWGPVTVSDPLRRGGYELPHQSQETRRDLTGETVARHFGGSAHAYRLTADQLQERRDGRDPGMPYEFLIYSPGSAALNWTAFYTRDDLGRWLDAYGLALSKEPAPGESFSVLLPENGDGWQPLSGLVRCYRLGCVNTFHFVPGRALPALCLDHAEETSSGLRAESGEVADEDDHGPGCDGPLNCVCGGLRAGSGSTR